MSCHEFVCYPRAFRLCTTFLNLPQIEGLMSDKCHMIDMAHDHAMLEGWWSSLEGGSGPEGGVQPLSGSEGGVWPEGGRPPP